MVVLVYTNDKQALSDRMKRRISILESIGYEVRVVVSSDWKSTKCCKVCDIIIDDQY